MCSIPDAFPSHLNSMNNDCASRSTIVYGTTCSFVCDTGYTISDSTSISCTESGALSADLPNCAVVTCSIPDAFPPHVIPMNNECSSGSIVEYNTICSFACDTGYRSSDSMSMSCTESGALSADLPNCEVVTCSIPDALPSHLSSLNNGCTSSSTIEYGTTCSFACDTGYSTSDSTSISCTESGALSDDLPNCEVVTCSIPDALPSHLSSLNNDCTSGSTIEYDSTCSFACDIGYNTSDSTSISCTENGALSTDLPNCTVVTCSLPTDFPSHLRSVEDHCAAGSATDYSTTCSFACDTGYNLFGSTSLSCTENGALSTDLPNCTSVMCEVPTTAVSVNTTCREGSRVTYSTSCEFSCTSGVPESGNTARFCRADGTFSGRDLTCGEVMCSIPVYSSMLSSSQCPSGGRVAVDTLCQFECESGEVTQPAIISCTSSGQLEAGVPQCRETCGSQVCGEGEYCGANVTCLCVMGTRTTQGICSDPCGGSCATTEKCTIETESGISTCNCAPGKARDTDTNQCLDAVIMEGTIRVLNFNGSEAVYSDALGNTSSSEFQEIAAPLVEQIMSTFSMANVIPDDVTITSIRNGSLIFTYELLVATDSNPEELANELSVFIRQHLESNGGIFDSSGSTTFLADSNATLLQVVVMDECSDPELNDCSSNANCMDHNMAGGFTCECFSGYRDLFPNVLPGRFCFPNYSEAANPGAALPRNYVYIAVGIVFGIVFGLMMLCLPIVCKRSYVRTKWRQSYEEKSVYNSTIAESHNREYPYLKRNGGHLFDESEKVEQRNHPLYLNYTRTSGENGASPRTSRSKGPTSNSEGQTFSHDVATSSSPETSNRLNSSKASSPRYGGQHLHYPYHKRMVMTDQMRQMKRLDANEDAGRYSPKTPREHIERGNHLPLDSLQRSVYVTRF
ncbi:P-selectin-like [Strongylocentrotus purpuratus]|uniref:Uncharacterized protein n=1 Tax=Strongylocentrotus purpuratus TaxID=7668 RepID=A0A7M7T3T5_STRPU|nr:P-selectin-like [Strongylocentrotus purpuratus]